MVGNRAVSEPDVVLIGAGIMSATLAAFLKELNPALNVEIFETLEGPAEESSDAWNNAGTGHAALCELNYTPERSDGSIDISKALEVRCGHGGNKCGSPTRRSGRSSARPKAIRSPMTTR
jgi:malate dehydrogenase (quinone)